MSLPLDATDASAQMAAAAEGNPDVDHGRHERAALRAGRPGARDRRPAVRSSSCPASARARKTISAAGSAMNGALRRLGCAEPLRHAPTAGRDLPPRARHLRQAGAAQPVRGERVHRGHEPEGRRRQARRLGCQPGGDRRRAAQRPATRPSFMTDTYTCDQRVAFSPITCSGGRRVFKVEGPQAGRPVERVVRRHDAGEARLTRAAR